MRTSVALLAALASLVYADDLFVYYGFGGEGSRMSDNPGYQPDTTQMFVATVVVANPSSTRLIIACPTGASKDCALDGVHSEYAIISKTRFEGTGTRFDTGDEKPIHNSWGIEYVAGAEKQLFTLMQEGGNDDTDGPVTGSISSDFLGYNTVSIVSGASLLSGDKGMTAPPRTATDSASAQHTSSQATPTATGSSTKSTAESAIGSTTGSTIGSATGSAPASASSGAATEFVVGKSALFALAGVAVMNMW